MFVTRQLITGELSQLKNLILVIKMRGVHVQNNLKTFLAKKQQILDLEATTHRMESLLDRAPAPVFESLYFAAAKA